MANELLKLTKLLEIGASSKELKLKNIENFLYGYFKAEHNKVIKWKYNEDNYIIYHGLKEKINYIEKYIKIKDNVIILQKPMISIDSIDEVLSIIRQMKKYVEDLELAKTKSNNNIKFLEAEDNTKVEVLNEEFIIENNDVTKYDNLINKRICEKLCQCYNLEDINTFKSTSNIYDKTKFFNELISKNKSGLCLINGKNKLYSTAKILCQGINYYYSNINENSVLNVKSPIRIDMSNYRSKIKSYEGVKLNEDVLYNIEMLFGQDITKYYYVLDAKAYFQALQDVKVLRGKKQCWICGKKLGLFEKNMTCLDHRDLENSSMI